ncbi:MAG: glycosyltransferase [Crocinitomicaceae bacterium]|nr:glycosyltransferase [Crocinitomicaceae bacterium]
MAYCIVVPCFNESDRLLKDDYLQFVNEHPEFNLLFVDDGSTDNTHEVLKELSLESENIEVLKLKANTGKASAIRSGIKEVLSDDQYTILGYLDADLAVPFSELLRLKEQLDQGYEYAFSSKKVTPGSELEYKFKRYFVGRVLSTLVKGSLKTKFFDTQCGCKLMTKEVAQIGFEDEFINPWLFDIEILWRLIIAKNRAFLKEKTIEVPVMKLFNRGSSRIKAIDLISLPLDFLKIHRFYKKKLKLKGGQTIAQ